MKSLDNILSVASQQIPFLNHDDCIRIELSCNQMRQSIALTNPEIPLIKTGNEGKYTQYSSSLYKAKHDGRCLYKSDNILVVEYVTHEIDVIDISIKNYLVFDKTLFTKLEPGNAFNKNDIIACTKNINSNTGELMLGKNLLVGFLSMEGWNFEDAIVVSESCAKKLAYRHIIHDKVELDRNDILYSIDDTTYKPCPHNGTFVNKGDVIFKKAQIDNTDITSLIQVSDNVYAPDSGIFYYNPFIKTESNPYTELSKWLKQIVIDQNKQNEYLIDIFNEFPNTDKYKALCCPNRKKIKAKTAVIDYFLINDKDLKIGSKLSNRHGNKGVVSIILPDDQMPKLDDGTPLDVVLNPLGVISRMNLGQLFEIHLTWAMMHYLEKIKSLPDDEFLMRCLEFIRIVDNTQHKSYSKNCFDYITQFDDTSDDCKNKQLHSLAMDIRQNGLQIIQPPFESCNLNQLKKVMKLANVSPTTTVTLDNGTKCECAVGWMYMMRLEHEPDLKIFGRSVGTYGKHDQAPSGTDAHRFGEMEVWCLLASEAWDTIKEFMSVKADNPHERQRFARSLYDGKETMYEPISLETTTSEVFKTYLKGCGLKVKF